MLVVARLRKETDITKCVNTAGQVIAMFQIPIIGKEQWQIVLVAGEWN